ncbi:hypothetical protein [Bacillus sp. JJ722]|uniref:hypothetical protein n=1 Tax=Bacillus sp. JJ722 TaxID=3122973 RepID=UPI0030001CDA
MQIGDVVTHRTKGIYGVVQHSTFGVSIHVLHEDQDPPALEKTVGMPVKEALKDWEVIQCPEDYIVTYSGLKKE